MLSDPTKSLIAFVNKEFKEEKPPVVIFGAGRNGKEFLDFFHKCDVKVEMIIDNDISKQGKKIKGVEVVDCRRLLNYDLISVIVSIQGFEEDIIQQIESINMTRRIRIYLLEEFKSLIADEAFL